MPPFLAAILANVAANMAAAPASDRIRAAWARSRFPGEPRAAIRRAPQVPPARTVITPPVSYGPPVPAGRPGSGPRIAAQLAARR